MRPIFPSPLNGAENEIDGLILTDFSFFDKWMTTSSIRIAGPFRRAR
jgi:hypothetical protein